MIYGVIVTVADSQYTDWYETQRVPCIEIGTAGALSIPYMREEGDTGAFDKHKIYAPGAWSEVCIEPITEDADE